MRRLTGIPGNDRTDHNDFVIVGKTRMVGSVRKSRTDGGLKNVWAKDVR